MTKIWPEDLFPLQPVGRMVLNKNPDNFFNENEQLAFCPALIVPGEQTRQHRCDCYPESKGAQKPGETVGSVHCSFGHLQQLHQHVVCLQGCRYCLRSSHSSGGPLSGPACGAHRGVLQTLQAAAAFCSNPKPSDEPVCRAAEGLLARERPCTALIGVSGMQTQCTGLTVPLRLLFRHWVQR